MSAGDGGCGAGARRAIHSRDECAGTPSDSRAVDLLKLMEILEIRNGLAVGTVVSDADGVGEPNAAFAMLDAIRSTRRRHSSGANKAYDTTDVVAACRERDITPHIVRNCTRRADMRTAIEQT